MVMKMSKINYLVWQTKKYVHLNFMALLWREETGKGNGIYPGWKSGIFQLQMKT